MACLQFAESLHRRRLAEAVPGLKAEARWVWRQWVAGRGARDGRAAVVLAVAEVVGLAVAVSAVLAGTLQARAVAGEEPAEEPVVVYAAEGPLVLVG